MKSTNVFPLLRSAVFIAVFAAGIIVVGFFGCKKELKFKDAILITGTETNNVVTFTVETAGSNIAVTATSTELAKEDIIVTMEIDTSLLAAFNTERNSNFAAPPAGSFNLSTNTVTIKAGTNISDAATLTVTSLADFVDGKPYMIPVTITGVQGYLGLLKSSKTVFLRIARVITTSAVDLTNGPYYRTVLANPILNLNAFTWEVRAKLFSVPQTGTVRISRLSVFDGNGSFNLLRWGESSDDPDQLQWINSSGAFSTEYHFEMNRWYTVSCVYDGTQCRMYIDGRLEGSFPAAGQIYHAVEYEVGMSDACCQTQQRFRGLISEFRIWNRALSVEEIRNGLCAVDPASPGLEAYWKINEGSGNKFTDYSGHGRDLTAPSNHVWVQNEKCAN